MTHPKYDPTSLGNLCWMAEDIDTDAVRTVVYSTPDSGGPLGERLVRHGAVTPAQLQSLLQQQARLRRGQPTLEDTCRLADFAVERLQHVKTALAEAIGPT